MEQYCLVKCVQPPRLFSNHSRFEGGKHLPRVQGIEILCRMSRCGGAYQFLRIKIDSTSFISATGYTAINVNKILPSYTGLSVLQTAVHKFIIIITSFIPRSRCIQSNGWIEQFNVRNVLNCKIKNIIMGRMRYNVLQYLYF